MGCRSKRVALCGWLGSQEKQCQWCLHPQSPQLIGVVIELSEVLVADLVMAKVGISCFDGMQHLHSQNFSIVAIYLNMIVLMVTEAKRLNDMDMTMTSFIHG